MFRLRSKVSVAVREDRGGFAVFGAPAAAALGLAGAPGTTVSEAEDVRFVDPRTIRLGGRWIGAPDAVIGRLAAEGIAEAPFAEYDRIRIALGVPDGTRDMEPE